MPDYTQISVTIKMRDLLKRIKQEFKFKTYTEVIEHLFKVCKDLRTKQLMQDTEREKNDK